jgi:3alpha(or 20beta)-hydroxysteroid dehydrogenase
MGEAHAERFVAEGAKVILTDLRQDAGSALAERLGENVIFHLQDVTSAGDWTRVVEQGEGVFGPITELVNNAGVLSPIARTDAMREESYLKVLLWR